MNIVCIPAHACNQKFHFFPFSKIIAFSFLSQLTLKRVNSFVVFKMLRTMLGVSNTVVMLWYWSQVIACAV